MTLSYSDDEKLKQKLKEAGLSLSKYNSALSTKMSLTPQRGLWNTVSANVEKVKEYIKEKDLNKNQQRALISFSNQLKDTANRAEKTELNPNKPSHDGHNRAVKAHLIQTREASKAMSESLKSEVSASAHHAVKQVREALYVLKNKLQSSPPNLDNEWRSFNTNYNHMLHEVNKLDDSRSLNISGLKSDMIEVRDMDTKQQQVFMTPAGPKGEEFQLAAMMNNALKQSEHLEKEREERMALDREKREAEFEYREEQRREIFQQQHPQTNGPDMSSTPRPR